MLCGLSQTTLMHISIISVDATCIGAEWSGTNANHVYFNICTPSRGSHAHM